MQYVNTLPFQMDKKVLKVFTDEMLNFRRRRKILCADVKEPFTALAFKNCYLPICRSFSFFRAYSGRLDAGYVLTPFQRISVSTSTQTTKPIRLVSRQRYWSWQLTKDIKTGDTLMKSTQLFLSQ
jgi:translation elongation factor EF-G